MQPHPVTQLDQFDLAASGFQCTTSCARAVSCWVCHITGVTKKEICITLVMTPQDTLESHLEQLSRKAVGDTQASILTREDVTTARQLLGRKHKLYRGSVAFYLRGPANPAPGLEAELVQLIGLAQSAGLSRIGFVAEPPAAGAPSAPAKAP